LEEFTHNGTLTLKRAEYADPLSGIKFAGTSYNWKSLPDQEVAKNIELLLKKK